MSARTDAMFEAVMSELLDDLARGPRADRAVDAALARTARVRQRRAWLAFDPGASVGRLAASPAPRFVFVALLLLIAAVAILIAAGQQRRPPPFGLARSGSIAYESGGHLWLADADGSSPHQLTFGDYPELAPAWSRDGTRLAFRRLTGDEPADDPGRFVDVLVMNADASNVITIESRIGFVSNPTWSPDSDWIAYTRTSEAGPDHLVIAAANGSQIRDLGDLGGRAWGPTWSPDGNHIAVEVGNDVVVVDQTGEQADVVSRGTYGEIGSQSVVGDWSPDAGIFAFAAGRPDQKRIYLLPMDGHAEVAIGEATSNQTDPVWSPDGSLLAYLRSGIGLGPSVVIADRAGREVRKLPGYYAWCTPVWSPDGSRIIVLDDRPGPGNESGPSVVLALDPDGVKPPIELAAPQGPIANDNVAGSQQRLAP